jgi:hypothetical protein
VKKAYQIETKWFSILVRAAALWMERQRGEGELEIISHGRFWISNLSFSQETGAIGQQIPRIGVKRPKAYRESSAGCTTSLTLSPPFFFIRLVSIATSLSNFKLNLKLENKEV